MNTDATVAPSEKAKGSTAVLDDEEDEGTTTATANTAAVDRADDIEFGDEELMKKGDGFDKFAPPENDKRRVVRVCMLSDILPPKLARTHFLTNKGMFRCNSVYEKGKLVKQAKSDAMLANDDKQKSQFTVVVLALWYVNADPYDGKYKKGKDGEIAPIEWQIGYIKLSKSGYGRVSRLVPEDRKPREIDIMIAWKENKIGFDYSVLTQDARFRKSSELTKEVMEAAEAFRDGKRLAQCLGKKITELEFMAMLAGKSATSAKDTTVDDVSDLG